MVVFLDQFCAKTNNLKFPFLDLKVLEAICLKSKHSFRQFQPLCDIAIKWKDIALILGQKWIYKSLTKMTL